MRRFLITKDFIRLTFLASTLLFTLAATASPTRLRTEQMPTPIGIDAAMPNFEWQSVATTANWMQSAYEILVATSEKNLAPGKSDVWDSGRVASSDSVNIVYGGPALKSQTRYFWLVRVWDNKAASSLSAPTWFETGLLSPPDWSVQWIRHDDPAAERELAAVRWLWLPGADAKKVPSGAAAEFHYPLHFDEEPLRVSLHVVTPGDFVATVNAIIARDMKEMALALGRKQDAQKYQALYDHIADAFRKEYVKEDGSVVSNSQSTYVVTLYSGLAPKNLRANMTDRLVKDIEAHGSHLTTGFLGTPFLMFVLDDNQRADIAFKLLLQDTYPSWGYMVSKGATTWWERWNGDTGDPEMNSYNHYAFGSVMAWVFRRVAGIDTDSSGAGFHHLTIKPHFDSSLPKLHTEYDLTYGTVSMDWDRASTRFTLSTPPNTTATVTLPDGKVSKVGSGEHTYFIK